MTAVAEELLPGEEQFSDETSAERKARLATQVVLSEAEQAFIDGLVRNLMDACDEISGIPLLPYETPLAERMFESFLINDGAKLTALFSRQSGKTETVADVVVTAMILLPRLAKVYPVWPVHLPGKMAGKPFLDLFADGVSVGAFAPVERQGKILFNRIIKRLSSRRAKEIMADPQIGDRVTGKGSEVGLQVCGSRVVSISCHPRSIIEGETFHIILIDEAQGAEKRVVDKSIIPMGTHTRATVVATGTPDIVRNIFYKWIQDNKRVVLVKGKHRQNHFEVPWQVVAKYQPRYALSVQDAMNTMGENSDEFRLAYKIEWLLAKGMFTTSEMLEELGDTSMQQMVYEWTLTPVCVGIDLGRKNDRSVITVVLVDWSRPDTAGYCAHRVLAWLDLEGMEWEDQYFRIFEFLQNYNIYKVGVDGGGLGDVVLNRLQTMMPRIEFVPMSDSPAEQSRRWKYLKQLMERPGDDAHGRMITWPQGAKVRRLRTWRRFNQEMQDLEMNYKGPNMKCEAPEEANAHDDYPDSLAMACILSKQDEEEKGEQETVVYENMLVGRNVR